MYAILCWQFVFLYVVIKIFVFMVLFCFFFLFVFSIYVCLAIQKLLDVYSFVYERGVVVVVMFVVEVLNRKMW